MRSVAKRPRMQTKPNIFCTVLLFVGLCCWPRSVNSFVVKEPHQLVGPKVVNDDAKISSTRLSSDVTSSMRERDNMVLPVNNATPYNNGPRFFPAKLQMAAMSATGALFSLAVIYYLGMNADSGSAALRGGTDGLLPSVEQIIAVAENVVDATVPLTATDVVSVAVGEGVAGLIGGAASFLITLALKWQREAKKVAPTASDVVADGDYFLARAAALPLIQAAGLPPALAMVATVVFATVPYELIKIQSKRRKILIKEDEVLQRLLEMQKKKEEIAKSRFSMETLSLLNPTFVRPASYVDLDTLKPVREKDDLFDFVEIITDTLLWLQYDILTTDFGGIVALNAQPLFPGAESALFGAISSVSAQIYSDVLFSFFGLGGDSKRDKIVRRTFADWTAIYFTRVISAAALFGVYDVAQAPVESIVSSLLSGGVLGCLGSDEYAMCVQSFIEANPTEPTREAQFRAVVTSLVSLWHQFVS